MALRVVVLVSGSGTLLQALLDACAEGTVDADVVAVGSDRPDCEGLRRAERARVATFAVPLERGADTATREEWDRSLRDEVARHAPDLVVSAGFLKLLGASFLARYGGVTINTHPTLLPSFPGMHGPRDALAHGVKVSGATVFVVDAGVDTGRIIAQRAVDVLDDDTVATLHERTKVAERALLVETVRAWSAAAPPTRSDSPPPIPEDPA